MLKVSDRYFVLFGLVILIFYACSSECDKFKDEIYPPDSKEIVEVDSMIVPRVEKHFHLQDFDSLFQNKYRIIFNSTLPSNYRFYEIVKNENGCLLSVIEYYIKHVRDEDYEKIRERDTVIQLSANYWEQFDHMFYKHQFWTSVQYKTREVADGWGFIIEGSRLGAIECNKRSKQTILRGAPEEDDPLNAMYFEIITLIDDLTWLEKH